MKFTQELKDKWLAALRSGEYTQGMGRLVKNNDGKHSYCCLGVLCKALGFEQVFDPENGHVFNVPGYGRIATYLGSSFPYLTHRQQELISLNDTEKISFSEIADYIEKNVPVET